MTTRFRTPGARPLPRLSNTQNHRYSSRPFRFISPYSGVVFSSTEFLSYTSSQFQQPRPPSASCPRSKKAPRPGHHLRASSQSISWTVSQPLQEEIEELWQTYNVPDGHRKLFRDAISCLSAEEAEPIVKREVEKLKRGNAAVLKVLSAVENRERSLEELKEMSNCVPDAVQKDKFIDLISKYRLVTLEVILSISSWHYELLYLYLLGQSGISKYSISPIAFYWKNEKYISKMKTDNFFLKCSLWTSILHFSQNPDPFLLQVASAAPIPDEMQSMIDTTMTSLQADVFRQPADLIYVKWQFEEIDIMLRATVSEAVEELMIEQIFTIFTSQALDRFVDEVLEGIVMEMLRKLMSDLVGIEMTETCVDICLKSIVRLTVDEYFREIARGLWNQRLREILLEVVRSGFEEFILEETANHMLNDFTDREMRTISSEELLLELSFDSHLITIVRDWMDEAAIDLICEELVLEFITDLTLEIINCNICKSVVKPLIYNEIDPKIVEPIFEAALEILSEDKLEEMIDTLITENVASDLDQYFTDIATSLFDDICIAELRSTAIEAHREIISEDITDTVLLQIANRFARDALVEELIFEEMIQHEAAKAISDEIREYLSDMLFTEMVDGLVPHLVCDCITEELLIDQLLEECLNGTYRIEIEEAELDIVIEEVSNEIVSGEELLQPIAELALQETISEVRATIADCISTEMVDIETFDLLSDYLIEITELAYVAEAIDEAICEQIVAELIFERIHSEIIGGFVLDDRIDITSDEIIEEQISCVLLNLLIIDELTVSLYETFIDCSLRNEVIINLLLEGEASNIIVSLSLEDAHTFLTQYFTERCIDELLICVLGSMPAESAADLIVEEIAFGLIDSITFPEIQSTLSSCISSYLFACVITDWILEFSSTLDLPIARSSQFAALLNNERLPMEFRSITVLEHNLEANLNEVFKLIPAGIRRLVEDPVSLMAAMRRGNDSSWLWVVFDNAIVGLVACYRHMNTLYFRHISNFEEGLYIRTVTAAISYMFKNFPYEKVRIVVAQSELTPEEKRKFGDIGLQWIGNNPEERIAFLGKGRSQLWRGLPANPTDIEISAFCTVSTLFEAVPIGQAIVSTFGNRPGLILILSNLIGSELPQPSNSLQAEVFDKLRTRTEPPISQWEISSPDRLISALQKVYVWPSSETRVLSIGESVYEMVRFTSVNGNLGCN